MRIIPLNLKIKELRLSDMIKVLTDKSYQAHIIFKQAQESCENSTINERRS